MSSTNNKPLIKLSCEELVALLKQENINQKVINFLTENDVNGVNFSESNFIDENILCEETKATLKLLPAQVSTLRKVHSRLCASVEPTTATHAPYGQSPPASPVTRKQQQQSSSPKMMTCSNFAEPSSPIFAENTSPTSLSSSSPRLQQQQHQDPTTSPNTVALERLRVEVDKFSQLEDATADKLQTAVEVLEELKKPQNSFGFVFTIIHGVVSGIHNATGGAKKDCLELIAKISRIVAGPNASFLYNPPRHYVPLFKEVMALAKEAKLLIAKFIPLTKEDKTFLSNVKRKAALLGSYKQDFDLIDKKINNIHIEISSAMSMSTNQILRYGPSGKIDLRAQARDVSDMKTFINEIKESCRSWYNENLKLELASKSASKDLIELEDVFIDLKIQRQVNTASIAENASGEQADVSDLHKYLFKDDGKQHSKLIIIEGPAGCGKTTCCQEFTRRQTIEGAIVIFVALKDLFGCGRMTSIEDILSFVNVPPCVTADGSLPEILKYDIPIVWILDGFDEVMLTDDGGVRFFLNNFVDPATRLKNIENKTFPDLVRPCDAVIISSRENRVDNKDVVTLNDNLLSDFWIIQRWQRPVICRYVSSYFKKARKPLSSENELGQIVDVTLSPQMQGFHGIPLFIKLFCDAKLDDPKLDVSKVTPPFLYQKSLRQAFDRAKIRISYVLNHDASWMKYENDRDKLFHDVVLQNASQQALREFLTHRGTALTFKVQGTKIPLWLSVMLEMGVLQRDKNQSDNSFKFPHRTFIEFLAAKRIALNPETDFSRIPFKNELNTTWLLICQIAKERDKDGFFDKIFSVELTSKRLAILVAQRFVAEYLRIPVQERHTTDESKISSLVSNHAIKLLVQIAVALPGDLLMNEIKNAHDIIVVPSHFKWMIEWCGAYGAIKVLKWIDKHYPSVVTRPERTLCLCEPENPSNDFEEHNRIRARCRLGLARALQARGTSSSPRPFEECIDFYLPRAGGLEAEDAIATDSHFGLQQVLTRRPWQGSATQLSKLVLVCISKRKSHPNLLAALLVFLQLDERADKQKCMPLLQLALFFAPEKVDVQNRDKSVEVLKFAEKMKTAQRWVQEPFCTELCVDGELMLEMLKSDSDLAEAFRECSEVDVEQNRAVFPSTVPAEEFLCRGFARLKYGPDTAQYILDSLKNKLPSSLKSLNLSFCVNEITDASLATLLPKYSSSLRTLNLSNCNKITDMSLQYLPRLSCLQSLNLASCKLITDSGLRKLVKMSSLQTLNLAHCNEITDTGLAHLATLSSLQTLELEDCKLITDSGLQHLAKLSSLHSLNFEYCNNITDSGLAHLTKLSSLKTLDLWDCDKISDSGLQHLAKLSALQSLNLGYCRLITDRGLEHLAKLSRLQTLKLAGCDKITDAGCRGFSASTRILGLLV